MADLVKGDNLLGSVRQLEADIVKGEQLTWFYETVGGRHSQGGIIYLVL